MNKRVEYINQAYGHIGAGYWAMSSELRTQDSELRAYGHIGLGYGFGVFK